jgi:Protein of unknown function (DUF2812)
MKKVFKPLWSLDIIKTEQWLADMALQGFHFVTFNRFTRCFYFKQAEPKVITYRIGFEKMKTDSLPSTLSREGWEKLAQSGAWYVTTNEQSMNTINIFPDREGIMKRNQIMKYIFMGILIYLAFITLIHFITLTLIASSGESDNNGSGWLPYSLFLLVVACGISFATYSLYRIKKTNDYFLHGYVTYFSTSDDTSKMLTKFKLDWSFSPDKLENWLESMEVKGFNLCKVNTRGRVFHFIKGTPRKVSYCVDYRSSSNRSYFDIHRDAGWKDVFSSNVTLEKWTIWSREYAQGEKRPHIYDDKLEHIKQARRVGIKNTMYLLPVLALMFLSIRLPLEKAFTNNAMEFDLFMVGAFPLLIISLSWSLMKTWLYFNRIRNQ